MERLPGTSPLCFQPFVEGVREVCVIFEWALLLIPSFLFLPRFIGSGPLTASCQSSNYAGLGTRGRRSGRHPRSTGESGPSAPDHGDVALAFGDAADDRRGGRASVRPFLDQPIDLSRIDRDQEPARGLRVERELDAGGFGTRLDPEPALEEIAVRLAGSGVITGDCQGGAFPKSG